MGTLTEERNSLPIGVYALAACQGLGVSAAVVSVTVSPLAGQVLGTGEALATVPYGPQFFALLAMTVLSSFLITRLGRKLVSVMGTLVGFAGGLLGVAALQNASWIAFCLAHMLIGASLAICNLYRFAALELAGLEQRSRAMSLVVFGGVGAAIAGPALSRNAAWFLPYPTFQAAYLAISALFAVSLLIIAGTAMPPVTEQVNRIRWSKAIKAARGLELGFGILAGAIGYLFMNMLMVADPLYMTSCGISFFAITYAIQAHVLAMFLPSLITGRVLSIIAAPVIILLASIFLAFSALVALYASGVAAFTVSLIALGLSWNVFYLGGSYIVANASPPDAKYHVQGLNEAIVGLFAMVGAMAPGALLGTGGWNTLNILAVTFASVMVVASALFVLRFPAMARSAGVSE